MLIAILSDIHGNLEAFTAVIDDLGTRKPDKVVCLGDLIGYGPNPEEIVQIFLQRKYECILGNHEAALKTKKMRQWLNFQAKENSIHTEKLLSAESLRYCLELNTSLMYHDCLFVHGFPPDSVRQYLTTAKDHDLSAYFKSSVFNLCFVGHTHDLLIVEWDGNLPERYGFVDRKYRLDSKRKYLVNAGSVGQPRDGNNNAKYLLWNTSDNQLEVVYVPYDFKKTARKIKERGFPDAYALRLW